MGSSVQFQWILGVHFNFSVNLIVVLNRGNKLPWLWACGVCGYWSLRLQSRLLHWSDWCFCYNACHPEIGAPKSDPEAATPTETSTRGSTSLTGPQGGGKSPQGDFGKDLVHHVQSQTRLSWKDPVQPSAPNVSSPTLLPAFLCKKTIRHPIPPTVLPLRAGQGRRKDQPTTDCWCFSNNA